MRVRIRAPQGLELEEEKQKHLPLLFSKKIKNKREGGLFVLQEQNTGLSWILQTYPESNSPQQVLLYT